MASDAGDRCRSLNTCVSEEVQTELGILAVPLSNVLWIVWGLHDSCLCAHFFTALPWLLER